MRQASIEARSARSYSTYQPEGIIFCWSRMRFWRSRRRCAAPLDEDAPFDEAAGVLLQLQILLTGRKPFPKGQPGRNL